MFVPVALLTGSTLTGSTLTVVGRCAPATPANPPELPRRPQSPRESGEPVGTGLLVAVLRRAV